MLIIPHTPDGRKVVDNMGFDENISDDPGKILELNIEKYMKEFRKHNTYPVEKIECQSEKNGRVMYTKSFGEMP